MLHGIMMASAEAKMIDWPAVNRVDQPWPSGCDVTLQRATSDCAAMNLHLRG